MCFTHQIKDSVDKGISQWRTPSHYPRLLMLMHLGIHMYCLTSAKGHLFMIKTQWLAGLQRSVLYLEVPLAVISMHSILHKAME